MNSTSKFKSTLQVLVGGHVFAAGMATYLGNDSWYKNVIMPIAHTFFDAETSHNMAVWMAKHKLLPRVTVPEIAELKSAIWGINFSNPVGLAAGFDKDGVATQGLMRLGFGFIEVGSVTPKPQAGNIKPRVFRLRQDQGIINRYGFNSVGHDEMHENLEVARKKNQDKTRSLVGVNLGKNKTSDDEVQDFVEGVLKLSDVADYLVVNVSSPNTPGLRDLQDKQRLQQLLTNILQARQSLPEGQRKPILLKLSPDLTYKDKQDVAEVVMKPQTRVDGLIVSNTTLDRSMKLTSSHKLEEGGLSGQPLKNLSTQTIKSMYILTKGEIPIVGVGGVRSGSDAYEKIRAGASLVQVYSALVFDGPCVAVRINKELSELLKKEKVENYRDIVGVDAHLSS